MTTRENTVPNVSFPHAKKKKHFSIADARFESSILLEMPQCKIVYGIEALPTFATLAEDKLKKEFPGSEVRKLIVFYWNL